MTQFGMFLPSLLGSIRSSLQDAFDLHLGSVLTAKYLSSGCFCRPSGLHPRCQYRNQGCFCPHFWTPSLLPHTSSQDASALHLGSILTAKYLSLGCFFPHSWAPSLLQELLTTNLSMACILIRPQNSASTLGDESRRMKSNHCLYIAKDIECIFWGEVF